MTRETVWPNLHLTRSLRRREAAGLPSVSRLPDGISGARIFSTCPVTPGCQICGVCGTIRLPPWTMAEFSPSSIKHSSVGFILYGDTIGHPCATSRFLCPTDSVFPHSTYIFANWKAQTGHPWQLEPLGTMQGAGYPNCSLRAFWKCLLFHGFLFSVLFIYSCMAFFEIWEGIVKQKNILRFRWLRLCTGPLEMAIPPVHRRRGPARGWTAGLFPTSCFGFWGGSWGRYTPALA